MKSTEKENIKFTVTDKFKNRAFELLDESQALQFAEGLRLNSAAAAVFGREEKRLSKKYGKDDPRTQDIALRREASDTAKVELFSRYKDVMTPPATVVEGWAVDGFVRGQDGRGVGGLTVAAYDKQGNLYKTLGRAMTDDQGHFAIKVDKLPDDVPKQVFMRASKGSRVLPSNDVVLTPKSGASERVEIIIGERERDPKQEPTDKPVDKAPTEKPADKTPNIPTEKPADKTVERPPDKPVEVKDKPPITATAVRPTIAKPVLTTRKSTAKKTKKSSSSKTKTARSPRAGTKKRGK